MRAGSRTGIRHRSAARFVLCVLLFNMLAATTPRAEETPPTDQPSDEAADPQSENPYWHQNLFGRFFRDQKYLFTTWWPAEFRRPQFTVPLAGGILLAAAPGVNGEEGPDVEFERYFKSETKEHGSAGAHALSFIGNAVPAGLLLGGAYLIGRMGHNDRLAEASSLSAEALLSSGLYSSVLKKLTARARPVGGSDGTFFNYGNSDGQVIGSFPSGHATGAFTVATVFAETYKDHKWAAWVAYGTAGLIGASRVAQGRHFLGDVIVGGVLGHTMGRMVVSRQQESRVSQIEIEPFFDPSTRTAGLNWSRKW